MRRLLRAFVPVAWTGEEALFAVRVLRQAIAVVWEVHGDRMADVLCDRPVERWHPYLGEDIGPHDPNPDDTLF